MSIWQSGAMVRQAQDRYQAWLDQLPARDQRLLWFAQIAVPLLLFYWLVWDPLMSTHAELLRSLPIERERAAQFSAQADAMDQLRARSALVLPGTQRSPRALIEASAARSGLAGQLQQIEMLSGDRVLVQLAPIEFDTLVAWLGALAATEGWRADSAQLKAAGEGRVRVERLVLAAGGH